MSLITVDYSTIEGGGTITHELKSVVYTGGQPINVPTTKKAKALSFCQNGLNMIFYTQNEEEWNQIYRSDGASATQKFKFTDSAIVSDSLFSSSNATLYCCIIYED